MTPATAGRARKPLPSAQLIGAHQRAQGSLSISPRREEALLFQYVRPGSLPLFLGSYGSQC